MNNADDLRTAIAQAIHDAQCPAKGDCEKHGGSGMADYFLAADAVIEKVLGDPVRRLAILNLIGDVIEGYGSDDEEGIWQIGRVEALRVDGDQLVFVVRPRGEATGQIDSAEAARRGLQRMREREAREARGEATDA